jgi:hypothetical protein
MISKCTLLYLGREYERERIREEILREEVSRRIIEEKVRRELEMEHYYSLRYPYLAYQGRRGQAPHNCFKRNHWHPVGKVRHTIMEINEGGLMLESPLSGEKVKPSDEKEIQKKKNEEMVQTEENRNEVKCNVSETSHKIMDLTEEDIRPPQTLTLLKEQVQWSKNQEELRPKASLPVLGEAFPNRNNIEKEGDGSNVLQPKSNKVEQLAFCQTSVVSSQNLLPLHINVFFIVFLLFLILHENVTSSFRR